MRYGTRYSFLIFKKGTRAMKGKPALRSNIKVGEIIAEIVRSSLGPRSMSKMLVNERREIMITNDGASILGALNAQHPVAKIMIDAARTTKKEVGDGTKSTIVLASELLKEAGKLIDKNLHPTLIIAGYEKACEKAIEYLNQMAKPVTLTDKTLLKRIAATSMMCRFASPEISHLVDIVVDAVLRVCYETGDGYRADLDNVKLVKYEGESLADTKLIHGIVLEKDVCHPLMPKRIENAKIALLACPLEIRGPQEKSDKAFPKNIITKPQQIEAFLKEELKILKDMVEKIVSTGANVVIVKKGVRSIDRVARHLLAREKVMAVRYVDETDIRRLSRATGAKIINVIEETSLDHLGHAHVVEERKVRKKRLWTFIEGCVNPKSVTILIRGGINAILCDAERSIQNALAVVRDVIEEPYIINGGGASEIEVAVKLRKWAKTMLGREQLAVLSFADALESIPVALARNAGMDPIETLTELRARHSKGEKLMGIDGISGKVEDIAELHVWEPLVVKRQVLRSAVELTNMILKVDFLLIERSEKELLRARYEKHKAIGVPPRAYKSSKWWGRLKTI